MTPQELFDHIIKMNQAERSALLCRLAGWFNAERSGPGAASAFWIAVEQFTMLERAAETNPMDCIYCGKSNVTAFCRECGKPICSGVVGDPDFPSDCQMAHSETFCTRSLVPCDCPHPMPRSTTDPTCDFCGRQIQERV